MCLSFHSILLQSHISIATLSWGNARRRPNGAWSFNRVSHRRIGVQVPFLEQDLNERAERIASQRRNDETAGRCLAAGRAGAAGPGTE